MTKMFGDLSEVDAFLQDDVRWLMPPQPRMTLDQGMEFVLRTRRQIERFDLLPNRSGGTLDPAKVARIRALLDKIEAGILANPNYKPREP